jgi:hypothetical protein
MLRLNQIVCLVSLICCATLVFAGASAQTGQGWKPRPDQNLVDDQPGYEPTRDDEQLPAELQKQLVFFRTTEPQGTIVVKTAERFL